MWKLTGGIFIGWALGSNDSANIFGTGVAAKVIKYRTAIILISIFVILGALTEGYKSMETVGKMSQLTPMGAFIAAFSAGLCVAIFSFLSLPVSTSQAIMGAVLGIGMISGLPDFAKLNKVILCWVFTPIGAMAFSFILYPVLGKLFERVLLDLQKRNLFIKAAHNSKAITNVTGSRPTRSANRAESQLLSTSCWPIRARRRRCSLTSFTSRVRSTG